MIVLNFVFKALRDTSFAILMSGREEWTKYVSCAKVKFSGLPEIAQVGQKHPILER